ncbi:MAG: hypothetical protein IKQ17_08970 [Kiritimatiellae bacterium]|nr:hypothetical protein [Kiritimatiellia bacterium]
MISRVVAAAALLIAGCRMFTCEPTMPEVDAVNISGDELVALLAGVEKVPSFRQRQNLASQLEGHRFTFHDLKRAPWRVGKDQHHLEIDMTDSGGMLLCPGDVRLFWFTLDVPGVTEELRNFARKTKDTKFSLDPVVKELDCTFGTNFTVTVNRFVPAIELAELPKFDAASITGDQLVDVLRGMKGRMSDAVGEDLAARLDGRELTFTNAQVTGVATIDDDTVGLLFRVPFGKEWDQAFDVGAVIPRKALAELPWNLWATPWNYGDDLNRLKGTVSMQVDGNLRRCGFHPALMLKNVEFDVPWRNDKLPDFDPHSITGEELVSLVSKFMDRGAKAKVDTVLERLNGRRLTFPEVVVQDVSTPADKDKNPSWPHSVRIDLDLSVSRVALRAAGKDGGEFEFYAFMPSDKAKTLSDNARLVDFTGTVVFHRTPFQPDFSTFEDVEFVQADKSEPLPKFDRKTVTGDDIVKLVESRTVALTGEQVKELGRQLDGVRVTLPLDGNQISSWNYYNPVWDGESGGLELCASYPRRIFRGWREMPILRVSARLKGVMRKEDLPFKDGEKNLRLTGTIRKSDFDSSLKLKDAVVEPAKQDATD